jgi:hypothetical protein
MARIDRKNKPTKNPGLANKHTVSAKGSGQYHQENRADRTVVVLKTTKLTRVNCIVTVPAVVSQRTIASSFGLRISDMLDVDVVLDDTSIARGPIKFGCRFKRLYRGSRKKEEEEEEKSSCAVRIWKTRQAT